MSYDYVYENYLLKIQSEGVVKTDRTGTGTKSLFGLQMRFNLQKGFPLITTKKIFTKAIIHELLWFLAGDTNIKYLVDNGVHIWDEWANDDGDLGPVYGYQWRSWPGKVSLHRTDTLGLSALLSSAATYVDSDNKGVVAMQQSIDQIANVVESLRSNPDGRRHIVSAWNPAQIDQMKLPPCHCLFQFYASPMTLEERKIEYHTPGKYEHRDNQIIRSDEQVHKYLNTAGVPKHKLSCQLYQRSADSVLGVPFNIASYALLTEMVAQQCNMVAHEFIWTGGDCHIYSNHETQVIEQLSRTGFDYPKLKLRKANSIFDYKYDDIEIVGYESHPAIKAPIAV